MLPDLGLKSLTLILTSNCNLRCSYCYQNAKRPGRMTWKTIRAAADFLLKLPSPEVALYFQGGEPLIEAAAITRVVDYVRRHRPARKKVNYGVCTNGTLLSEGLTDFLAENRFEIRLSFDGVCPMQNQRGEGTFVRLDKLLTDYSIHHPDQFRRLQINITLTPQTISHLADSVDYFLGRGVRQIGVSPVFNPCGSWTGDIIEALDAQFSRIFDLCLRHRGHTRETPFVLFRKNGGKRFHWKGERPMCGIVRGNGLTVDIDGQMYGCAVLAESYQHVSAPLFRTRQMALKLGRLGDPKLSARLARFPETLKQAAIFHHKEQKHSSFGSCASCRYLDCCSVCPLSIVLDPENRDLNRVPDFACAFNKIAMAYRDCFPVRRDALSIILARMEVRRLLSLPGL